MKRLVLGGLVLVGLAYPALVYVSLGHVQPRWLVLLLAAIWLLRALVSSRSDGSWRLPALVTLGCLLLAVFNEEISLRCYPVLVNAGFLFVFARSLWAGPPVVERMARLTEPDLSAAGQRYTRRVTQVWCGFFVINGTVAAVLALWADWSWWALYTGLLSYVAMGVLFAVEWLWRPHARRRMEVRA